MPSGFIGGLVEFDEFNYTTPAGTNNDVMIAGTRVQVTCTNDLDTITGLTTGGDTTDALVFLVNVSTTNRLVITHNDSGSAAANRFLVSNGTSLTIPPRNLVVLGQVEGAGWAVFKFPDTAMTGEIKMWGTTTAPADWFICDGSAISRTTYAALFAVIGTTFGAGNGTTTFNIPDMRQRFPLGKAASGTGSTLGETGGAIDHTHTGTTGTPSGTSGQLVGVINVASATHTHDFTTSANNPPFLSINFIIKS